MLPATTNRNGDVTPAEWRCQCFGERSERTRSPDFATLSWPDESRRRTNRHARGRIYRGSSEPFGGKVFQITSGDDIECSTTAHSSDRPVRGQFLRRRSGAAGAYQTASVMGEFRPESASRPSRFGPRRHSDSEPFPGPEPVAYRSGKGHEKSNPHDPTAPEPETSAPRKGIRPPPRRCRQAPTRPSPLFSTLDKALPTRRRICCPGRQNTFPARNRPGTGSYPSRCTAPAAVADQERTTRLRKSFRKFRHEPLTQRPNGISIPFNRVS